MIFMHYYESGRHRLGLIFTSIIIVASMLLIAMPANSVVSGSVRYWDLDEGSGNVISDSVSGDIASVNGATWVDGLTDTGLSFDGVANYVGMSDSPDMRPASLTISLWIKVNVMKDCGLAIKRSGMTGSDANWQVEMFADGDLRFSYHDGNNWQTLDTHIQPVTETNRWYNIAMTFDSGNIVIYVDGSIRNSGSGYPALDTTYTGQVQFGRGWDGYFNGVMDEVTLYDRALTASEISIDFNSYDPPTSSGQTPINPNPPVSTGDTVPLGELMAHWDFDHMKTSDVLDVTGNGNDAGTSGGTEYADGVFWDCFVFTGDNFMETYDKPDLNMGAFTIELWLNPSEYGGQNTRILEKGGYQVGGGYGIEFNRFGAHNLGFLVWDGTTSYAIESEGEIPINEWTYVIASFDGADLRLYINGEAQGQPVPASMSTNTAPMYVGRAGRAYTDLFVGQVDELKLWEGGAVDADATQMFTDAEPTFMNKLNMGFEDLSGTLLNSKYFYFAIGVIVLLIITLIGSWASLRSKKDNLKHRFKQAKEAGFDKEFELGKGEQDKGKHVQGQELFDGWKEAVASSYTAENFITVDTLNEYTLLATSKFWGVMVSGDKETETFKQTASEAAGISPTIHENPKPTIPTDYKDDKQVFAISSHEKSCPDCEGIGTFHCTTCDGNKDVRCPDCHGEGVAVCSSCHGEGGHSCTSCNGRGSSDCSVCGGSGTLGGKYGATTWTTSIDEKGSHSEAHTSYSEKETCYSCHGSGKSECFSCGSSGRISCEKCKGQGNLDCGKCSTTGTITCPVCKGVGRTKCHRCGGSTILQDMEYRIWDYNHHSLQEQNKDIQCEIKEKEYLDDSLGTVDIESLETAVPEHLPEKDSAALMLEWARARYNSWEVGGDKILFERFRAKLIPVTGIKVQAPPGGKKGEQISDFWLWTVGGRTKSRLYAHETPDNFNTKFSKHKWSYRLIMLAEFALLAMLILMAFDISILPL